MDKFDESMKQAKATCKSSEDFTDRVMHAVANSSLKQSRSFGWRKFSVALASFAAAVVVVFAGGHLFFQAAPANGADEYSTEINAINSDFAADNANNSAYDSQLNDLNL